MRKLKNPRRFPGFKGYSIKSLAPTHGGTRPRRRPENVKQQVVEAREFEDIRLVKEHVAEFRYRPAKCKKEYRVVAVWKELDVYRGQKRR